MTSVAVPQEQSIIVGALTSSFHKWAANHPRFKALYKKIPKTYSDIIHAGLSEMHDITPGAFHLWWVKNHMRFGKRNANDKGVPIYREKYKRDINQLMYHFLTDYVRGKL